MCLNVSLFIIISCITLVLIQYKSYLFSLNTFSKCLEKTHTDITIFKMLAAGVRPTLTLGSYH